MGHDERKRVWVDQFQTRLVRRIAAYLGLFMVVLINFLFAWKLAFEGGDPLQQLVDLFRQYLPVLICLVVLVPVMAWDAVRFTHRLVGPLVRFHRTMQSISNGEPVRPIKLREGDHLTQLRDDFNQMLAALQRRGVPILQPDVPTEDESQRKPA